MLAAMAAPLLWLGLYPQPLFNVVRPGLAALQQRAVRAPAPTAPGAILLSPPAAGRAAAAPPMLAGLDAQTGLTDGASATSAVVNEIVGAATPTESTP
jgi:hypothetical protein